MNAGVTLDSLLEIVSELQPLELKGTVLLRQHRSQGNLFPQAEGTSREALSEAITEIIQYTQSCQKLADQLNDLSPIPIVGPELLEYGL